MDQNNGKPAPIGQEAPKSPADRVRLIQEMQRAAEAAAAQPAAPIATPAPAAQVMGPKATAMPSAVNDVYGVQKLNAIAEALANKTTAKEANAYARAQQSTSSLFGGSTDVEVLGNPWKVISFNDVFPALFDEVGEANAKVPEKAVKAEGGALFEVGMQPKGSQTVSAKRAVLVDGQGKLLGAECKTPQDAQRLLQNAQHLLPDSVKRPNTSWKVTAGVNSAFTLEIERGAGKVKASERLTLDNFGRVTTQGRRSDIVVANYFLDRFEATV